MTNHPDEDARSDLAQRRLQNDDKAADAQAERSAMRSAFNAVEFWVFDLDNTLYSSRYQLFDQIDRRMTAFISEALGLEPGAANALRAEYWRAHGTTLNGLMREHGMGADAFLDYVHDIDLSAIPPAPELAAAINALPGRKIVHTNGSRGHAERVTEHLGVSACFEALFGIEDSDLIPKPDRAAYEKIAALGGVEPKRAAMLEDTARNLLEPHNMGMRTVWTPTDCALARDGFEGEHVHFTAHELTSFLTRLAEALGGD